MKHDEIMCFLKVKFEDCGQKIIALKSMDENLSITWFFENKCEENFILKNKKYEFVKMIQNNMIIPFNREEIKNVQYADINALIKEISSHAICFDEILLSFSDLPVAVITYFEFPWNHMFENQISNPNIKLIEKHKNSIEKIKDEDIKEKIDLAYCHKYFMQTIKESK